MFSGCYFNYDLANFVNLPQLLPIFSPVYRGLELMRTWGFALREGVFAETKEGIVETKIKKLL